MESAVEIEPSEARSEGVGEKRPAEEDGDVLKEKEDSPPPKRIKGGSGRGLVGGDVKKVAEMVLVLAAMGKMRGGKGPTAAEKELMVEARNRLAKVCEGFAPKDVFPGDAFGGVIEDLGLNKLKEQKLVFRPPKLSIAEKLLISKRKMEKAENFSLPSTPQSSQRLQGNPGTAVENRGASHPVQMSQLAKSNHLSISRGNFQPASPLGHVTGSKATPPTYQLPTSEVRPTISSALPSGHLGAAVLPRVDRPHLRSDGRPNGPVHPSQIQVNYSANSNVRTPWSLQSQSTSSAKVGSDNKVPFNMSLKGEQPAEVKSGLPTQAMSRTVNAQTSGSLSQGTKYVQAPPMGNNHIEIGKIVQKILQPGVTERPTWTPPSRDYMNKALTCQMCMSTATDTDSVLICDACEKGYHLKCLQTTNQTGVPKGEWHCGKCLSLSNGKPLPPKYGKVMRNMTTPKLSPNSATLVSASSKKVDALDDNVGKPTIAFNGNSSMQNVPTEVTGNNFNHQTPGSLRDDAKGIQENDNASTIVKMDDKIDSKSYPSNLMENSHSASDSHMDSSLEKTSDGREVELKPNNSAKLELITNLSDMSQATVSAKDAYQMVLNAEPSPLKPSQENHVMVWDSEESQGGQTTNNANQQKEHGVIHDNPSELDARTGVMTSSNALHAVEWVGNPIQVLDDKIYYAACRINGHLYRSMDHVLIHFEKDKLVPSKLQAMWEDKNTTMKWVTVNRCYFPGELPEAVAHPCSLEGIEVYESTFGKTMMIDLIENPCEVLPPRQFAEESERRSHAVTQPNDRLPPLYLCKWIYDEAKGLFRDISC